MKESTTLSIMAFLAALVVLASSAFAACSSCAKEGNWQDSANAFIAGEPINDDPMVFTAKVARAESSQFEKNAQMTAGNDSIDNDLDRIILKSINATPATLNSTGTTRIMAVFAINDSEREGQGEMQLSANAVIRDSAGSEVAKLPLIRQSAGHYSNNWTADVPPGIYSLDIAAFSLDGAASFKEALQIEVLV